MRYTAQEKSMKMWEKGRVLRVEECEVRHGLVHGTCPGLIEGNEYMFRIKAVNIGRIFHLKGTLSPAQNRLEVVCLDRLWLGHPSLWVLHFFSLTFEFFYSASKFLTD